MAKEKWASDVTLREGALTRDGWPSVSKIIANIRAGKSKRGQVMRRLAFISGMGNAKAKAAMARIKSELGPPPSEK